jgi:hypothetical protein
VIDTLTYAKRLENAGFTKEESEALIMLASELSFQHLATKTDLKALETKMELSMHALENRLIVKLGTMMGAMLTVFFAAMTCVILIKG